MSLAQKLVSTHRDTAGANTYSRYEYQSCYGLALAFKIHSSKEDYAIAFEFHDDILLLDSSTAPSKIKFFQIKTKDKGHWTPTELTSRKSGKNGVKLTFSPLCLHREIESFVKNSHVWG